MRLREVIDMGEKGAPARVRDGQLETVTHAEVRREEARGAGRWPHRARCRWNARDQQVARAARASVDEEGAVQEKFAHTEDRLHYGAELVLAHVDTLADPIQLFNRVPDHVRRDLLGALFTQMVVNVEDDKINISSERSEVNDAVHHWETQRHLAAQAHVPTKRAPPPPRISAKGSLSTSEEVPLSKGWNILNMVGLTGFEPATP
ncbi:hypothetical protein L3i23_10740 [Herbiconiux sp. L3-i23]|nr:hypothetical protein L3i23_10740 [Herbiconiux sp. L3-i23]